MTTYFQFIPSNISPPIFQPTFDGSIYTCAVVWSLFGQRYNLNCIDSSGNIIFTGIAVTNTLAGVAIDTLSWDAASLTVTLITNDPHNYKIGSTTNLTIQNTNPDTYNVSALMLATNPFTLTFPMITDPGILVQPGTLNYLVNMVGGYFISTLIFRNGQFEVSP